MNKSDPCSLYQQSEAFFYNELLKERHEAFMCLYKQTYQLCLPFALSKGSKQEEAEDLLQECLAIFVEKLRSGSYTFLEGAKITTYFYRIYINQWKKAIEHKVKRAEVQLQTESVVEQDEDEFYKPATSTSPFVAILRNEEGENQALPIDDAIYSDYDDDERAWIFRKLNRAFHLLAEDCQKVLNWFYVEDWSLRQIAEALNMTEASATGKRFKCAKYLKEKFRLA
ncbi:RNA polymerase sigma factor [Telluribacter humicola]|uniref:RNA polymerase sigma factor n=1 Tax=Telluribacter humicola TaxID=1720261 RepID=UPI001A972313|nr:sigma-70 family RNA polymerase sigma factor [Telluribacter humicola]